MIVSADTGRKTVIMNKSDYENKITEHLQDNNSKSNFFYSTKIE